VQFVSQQKRLPCPADGTLAASANNAGSEMNRTAAGCGSQQNGMVPWRTLGLTELDATDGWDRRLTYRTQPGLAADNGMDMSWCDPAGTEALATPSVCNANCTSTNLANCTPPKRFLIGRGLTICDATGTGALFPCPSARRLMDKDGDPHTGAAYVVVSHGESGGGAYLNTGQLTTSTVTDGLEERLNYANRAYAAGEYYVDNAIVEVSGDTHFDDVVSRPAVGTVIAKAGLGARAH
jgi:hypothetical protein